MKTLKRTTMTWRFVNLMAPAQANHMPTKVYDSDLVEVTATMFRGKAILTIWFEAEKFWRESNAFTRSGVFASGLGQVVNELGAKFDIVDDEGGICNPVWANGSCILAKLTFGLKSGESFIHAAMQKFVKLVTLIGKKEWRKRYYLPIPQIVQETMVEAYVKRNWVTYGDYLYDRFQPRDPLGPKSEHEEEFAKGREARSRLLR